MNDDERRLHHETGVWLEELAPRTMSALGMTRRSPWLPKCPYTELHRGATEPHRGILATNGYCGPGAVSARSAGRFPAWRSPMGMTTTQEAILGCSPSCAHPNHPSSRPVVARPEGTCLSGSRTRWGRCPG